MAAMGRALILLAAMTGALLAGGSARADCNQPSTDAITHVALSGHPFSAIPTGDGCTIFVSLTGKESHIVVLKRDAGAVTVLHDNATPGMLTGMALSPDGRFLAAANGAGVTLFDTAKLIAGTPKPELGYLNDRSGANSIYAAFSPDQHLLAVSDEGSQTITIYDFAGLLAGRGTKAVGEIHTGNAPVGLVFSPDGKRLYNTSQVASPNGSCRENGSPSRGPGELIVIDVNRAATSPSDAVLARAPAGCSPVRVAVSPDGGTLYVTARADNALLAFDAAKLVNDPGDAKVAQVTVGVSPVGVAVAGGKIFVTNSQRFAGGSNQTVSVLEAANLAGPQASIPAGGFPRELKLTADGKTLLVTNFNSGTLELVDLSRQTVP